MAVARQLLQTGKYAEAEEAYRAELSAQGPPAAVGIARCLQATGQRGKAVAVLDEAIKVHPDAAMLPAELARLSLSRGEYQAARKLAEAALKLDDSTPLAHWVRAESLAAVGDLPAANAEYKQLVDYYNEHDSHDAEALVWIGLAAGQYARWNRLSEQFGFLVNEFYPDLAKSDTSSWQAHYEAGRLFAEKYNQADALKELNAAVALNANAAEVHAALGELSLEAFEIDAAKASAARALEIDPESSAARLLQADIQLANFDPRAAALILADAVRLNPHAEESLGRLAATYLAVDGIARPVPRRAMASWRPKSRRVIRIRACSTKRWPTRSTACGAGRPLPTTINKQSRTCRSWPAPPGQLGMMLMRLGDEERAKQVLDKAFAADPFNVRVNNSLKVLEVLDGYATHETEHFRIKFDGEKDAVLARYMGQWLEEVYPQLVKQLGYAPQGKSLFEVFSSADNTDGHGWFSARMVGLPNIHPIGACAGKIVALQSPSEGPQRFNWARVLKHEFIHVVNLQQTDFNIPHWFTEALAVLNEGYPRPQEWNELLVASRASNKLFDLDNINLGFIRPQSSAEWTLAYCQAELYAEYMLQRFGDQAIARMLTAYANNLTTPEALQQAFGVSQQDFEAGYRKFVEQIVAELPAGAKPRELNAAEVQQALAKNPRDPDMLAHTASLQLARKSYPSARRSADAALAVDPKNGLAHYVRARLHLLVGENNEALARLEGALDREHPDEHVLGLLAGLKLKAEDYPAAAELYELGAHHHPGDSKWDKSLAAVYLRSGDDKKLAAVLERLAAADPDELTMRKKLAKISLDASDWAGVERWTREALQVDVRDVDIHDWRAQALAAGEKSAQAADEYAVAVELDPEQPQLRIALAQARLKAGQTQQAKDALKELLERDPQNAAAAKLLEGIP